RHLHHPRLPLPRRRRADDQFPPAEVDPVHAGQRLRGAGDDEGRLRPRRRGRLPLLLLRRRQPAVSGSGVTEAPPEALAEALEALAVAAADADLRDPWWVFGGAAMALLGLTDWRVPDID